MARRTRGWSRGRGDGLTAGTVRSVVGRTMGQWTRDAVLETGGRQVAEIRVRDGYAPSFVRARAGVPLRIVFDRQDDDPCTERVVFSAPRIDRRLASVGTTIVDLPAQEPGVIRFTCGMGRFHGRIEIVDAGRMHADPLHRLVAWLGRRPPARPG